MINSFSTFFLKILAHFRPCNSKTKENDANSRISKTRLVFDTFDRDRNGRVTREELLEILRLMVRQFFSLKIDIINLLFRWDQI